MDEHRTAKRVAIRTKTRPDGARDVVFDVVENKGLMLATAECTAQDLNLEPTD